MKSDYPDIIDAITRPTREHHFYVKEDEGGPSPDCLDAVDPETAMCTCVATPLWWDENGVPRFAAHSPDLCPDIYADEVALVRIGCQSCEREFEVQMSSSMMDLVRQSMIGGASGKPIKLLEDAIALARSIEGSPFGGNSSKNSEWHSAIEKLETQAAEIRARKPKKLADQIRDGSVHYGDPPNVGCCPAGPTLDLRVMEFWVRGGLGIGWERVPALEIELPDATDPEFEKEPLCPT